MASELRGLSSAEIAQLTAQNCSCEDWSKVKVAAGFDPARVRLTHFSGKVELGVFDREVTFCGGVTRPAGISNATIHNCRIGDNVYISQIKNCIANYAIEDEVVIENIDLLAVEKESSFGNGTQVCVVNEAGGREIPIYDRLSAHLAYIIAFYRHRPKVIAKLQEMIGAHTASVTSSTGLVGKGAKIINCRIIKNVKVGPASVIEGVNRLENGSVNSCRGPCIYRARGFRGGFYLLQRQQGHRRYDNMQLLRRSRYGIIEAIFGGKLCVFRKLRRFSRGGVCGICGPIYGNAP